MNLFTKHTSTYANIIIFSNAKGHIKAQVKLHCVSLRCDVHIKQNKTLRSTKHQNHRQNPYTRNTSINQNTVTRNGTTEFPLKPRVNASTAA